MSEFRQGDEDGIQLASYEAVVTKTPKSSMSLIISTSTSVKMCSTDKTPNEKQTTTSEKYQQILAEKGWYDYDDMISMVVEKLRNDSNFLAELQEQ